MTSSLNTVSPDFFKSINAHVSSHIRKKLQAMEIEVVDLELHNSSLTKTFRVYLTLKRTASLKALSVAEQILTKEIERQFLFRPHAFYWRYAAEAACAQEEQPANSLLRQPS
jgi:hypothetical protein